jgi:hypothetical protein
MPTFATNNTTKAKTTTTHNQILQPWQIQSGSDNPLLARDRVHLKSAIDYHAAGDCF